ncbi:protein-L-isoaspartate O-methyltransferase [Ephemerocybe angulata]|uniref:protein-L-isoaspartate(D-aspartate) O-methyltransferase n=1 Tax=Ephemerocybe angulata TaxID=980116 RepID=A0A8H6I8S3_9AGAR|nr:protein-L-isoaspartate O-methyltransferase [Tulosesus angulatus]
MAWRSIGTSKEELFSNLFEKVRMPVDRANYVRDKRDVHAYDDLPQSIGHAFAVEHLLDFLHPGARVLDIGSGSGCLVAVMHRLVGDTGKVVGIERIPELVIRSKRNLRQDGLGHALDSGAIEMVAGDGRDGYAPGGPYDAIHVGISATATVPQVMLDQLASPGRMLIPVVGPFMQEAIEEIEKDKDGNVTRRKVMDIVYVLFS